jgi:hypothetical protein
MKDNYNTSGQPLRDDIPEMPKAVMVAVTQQLHTSLDKVLYDSLCDYWYIPNYKGMFIGIERDGYTHS